MKLPPASKNAVKCCQRSAQLAQSTCTAGTSMPSAPSPNQKGLEPQNGKFFTRGYGRIYGQLDHRGRKKLHVRVLAAISCDQIFEFHATKSNFMRPKL